MTQRTLDSTGWRVVCLASEIAREAAQARVVENRRLVVWRDAEGDVHVWDDYCPHRGAGLSEGRVSGGLILCPAHGWRFDVNGQAVRPLTSSTMCREASFANVYEVMETEDIVWAYFGGTVGLHAPTAPIDA
jgi:phenylpropionate dioxygenase-like ring-hydroxylating dioxygenase large terminal subunit